MSFSSVAALCDCLRQNRLLEPAQETELMGLAGHFSDPRDLARELVQRGWLTPYQVNELFLGRGSSLLLGSYVLLDRLGEGGMGQVFKARHRRLNRIVAIKLIRPERLSKPDTVRRFQREIRAAAQLEHPNIVRAFDADEVGGIHFFIMEYVDGTDLARFVKTHGALPVGLACDYIRQAARGLQHAFERGLVHRDIKPHNLLVSGGVVSGRVVNGRETNADAQAPSPSPHHSPITTHNSPPATTHQIKILDMGLARLAETTVEDDGNSGTMTQQGVVMGTPDYLAPEQSRDSHTVDIRADLYSLGCTFYFLLAGRVPFPGGSFTEKLLKHQLEAPEPLEKVRPEVPQSVSEIVSKLMAKRPGDRYQTPSELIEALDVALFSPLPSTDGAVSHTAVEGAVEAAPGSSMDLRGGTLPMLHQLRQQEERQRLMKRGLVIGGSAALVLIGLSVWAIWMLITSGGDKTADRGPPIVFPINPGPKKGEEPATADLPKSLAAGPVTDAWINAVRLLPAKDQAQAVFAKMKELNDGFDDQHKLNTFGVKDDKVIALSMQQNVTDISPLRALKDLESLECIARVGSLPAAAPQVVSLASLSSLKGLPLRNLNLSGNRVEDLSPLTGMPLVTLKLSSTRVYDLRPLWGMASLQDLQLKHAPVADLSPLRGLNLARLDLTNTQVQDLRPLAGLPLTYLNLRDTDVRDLAPLALDSLVELRISGCPVEDLTPLTRLPKLKALAMRGAPFRSLEPLQALKPLRNLGVSFDPQLAPPLKRLRQVALINGQKAADFWRTVDPDPEQMAWAERISKLNGDEQIAEVLRRMRELNPGSKPEPVFKQMNNDIVEVDFKNDVLADLRFLAPLKKLQKLNGGVSSNLEPLRGLPLKWMRIAGYNIRDLSPLAGMPLEDFAFNQAAAIEEATVFQSIPTLRRFGSGSGQVHRLAPFAATRLTHLATAHPPRDAHALENMKSLESIHLPYDDFRHRHALKAMTWLKTINGKKKEAFWIEIAEQQVDFVRRELKRLNPSYNGGLTHELDPDDPGVVKALDLCTDDVTNLSPLRTLSGLHSLNCRGSQASKGRLTDLRPLKDLPNLRWLHCNNNPIVSLEPLRGLPLTRLSIANTKVTDLTPLRECPLDHFWGRGSDVSDITPLNLKGMKLLDIVHTKIPSLAPLTSTSLKKLRWDVNVWRDAELLRSLTALEDINDQPIDQFWKDVDKSQAPFEQWCDEVAKLPAAEQVAAVEKKLQQLNPPFADKVQAKIEGDDVVELSFRTVWIHDIAPVRALRKLKKLTCAGTHQTRGGLTDLWPLQGTRLEALNCSYNSLLWDLRPLQGLPLQALYCYATRVYDLSPITDLPLRHLAFWGSLVDDLTSLKGMKLDALSAGGGSKVTNLSPIAGMHVKSLDLANAPIRDLTPLTTLPELTSLWLNFVPWRDSALLRSIKTLKRVETYVGSGKFKRLPLPEIYAWSEWEDAVRAAPPDQQIEMVRAKLKDLNPGFDGQLEYFQNPNGAIHELRLRTFKVANISPVRALPHLTHLRCQGSNEKKGILADLGPLSTVPLEGLWLENNPIKNLAPLSDMKSLKQLVLHHTDVNDLSALRGLELVDINLVRTNVTDLAPLKGMPLAHINANYAGGIKDLAPLRGAPLTQVFIDITSVRDLSPLAGMKLKSLSVWKTPVSDHSVARGMPLELLSCNFNHWRDTELLKSFTGLKKINGKPAAEFWKDVENQRATFDAWANEVRAMIPEEQVKAVAIQLKQRNPGLDEKHLSWESNADKSAVLSLTIRSPAVVDIAPVRALEHLESLDCEINGAPTKLSNLWPLKDLKLKRLCVRGSAVEDFAALQDTGIVELYCDLVPARDAAILGAIAGLKRINGQDKAEWLKEIQR